MCIMEIKVDSAQICKAITELEDQKERLQKLNEKYEKLNFRKNNKSTGYVAQRNMEIASDDVGVKCIKAMMLIIDRSVEILVNASAYEEKDMQIATEIKKGC